MYRATLFLYTFLTWYFAAFSCTKLSYIESNKSDFVKWAVQLQSSANSDDVQFIANTLGLMYQKILPNNYYLLTHEHNQYLSGKRTEQITETLKSFSKVIWVERQVSQEFESRSSQFFDPYLKLQYQLVSNVTRTKSSQHIEDVWAKGYSGKNISVAVIDDGVNGSHPELKNRYNKNVSAIIANRSRDTNEHGTQCAGVIAAEANNGLCGVGVAYDCKIAGIRLYSDKQATDADEAQAFYRDHINPTMVDIFSNSWGPPDTGFFVRGPGRLAAAALELGILKGRRGLGSIYVFSCGNGALFEDSCAFDGYVNSIYTIPVASITKDGKLTSFSEPCSAVMTAVYSSDMVTISGRNYNECVLDFGRTSAAAAFVSGILALALEANPNITWRDMQHLIARSSNWNNVDQAVKRVTNAKKYTVNEDFGFGVLDASVLINNAKKWNVSVPSQLICTLNVTAERGPQTIPAKFNINITKEKLNCQSELIHGLEHVQLRVDLDYPNRAVLSIDVQSMSGTPSRFVYPRQHDASFHRRSYNNLVVTSVHFWGEPLLGNWTVDIKDRNKTQGTGTLINMSFIFYGTAEVLSDNGKETKDKNNFDNNPSNSKTGVIVGASVAGVVAIAAASSYVAYKWKVRSNHSTQNDTKRDEQEHSQNTFTLTSG